ncbi:MAG: copper transporter [Microthrixaceae bacterium]|nr:copper transporter [Microthrixaceae bacterium]
MVSFRFYVVATVALFLALAVGIVVGSALNETIVSSLKESIARVESNLDESVLAMEKRKREIDELDRFIDAAAPYAVEGRLDDTSTLVLADPGASEAQVDELVALLGQARTELEGVVWLGDKWNLDEQAHRTELAEITDTADSGTAARRRSSAWDAVMSEIRAAGGSTPATPGASTATTTTVASGAAAGVDLVSLPMLKALAEAGFVEVEPVEDGTEVGGVGGELLVVVVNSSSSPLGDSGLGGVEIVNAAAGAGLGVVAAESYDPSGAQPERATTLRPLREASPEGVSTVDDLDLVAGRVGTVLALADLLSDRTGHYGYGPGVDRVLPEWVAN